MLAYRFESVSDPVPASGVSEKIPMQKLVVIARDCVHRRFQKAHEDIGGLERYRTLDIADAPAPLDPVIGGWTEHAFRQHRA